MKKISETLKELRKKNGKTQLEIGELLNITDSAYSKIETGNADINLSKLEIISNLYNMSVIELLAYPKEVKIIGEPIKPKVSIMIDITSKNQAEKVAEVLQKINDINVEINN